MYASGGKPSSCIYGESDPQYFGGPIPIGGAAGDQQAAPILLAGLEKLEYRGYDSAGLAVRDGERVPEVVKGEGTSARAGREDRQWTRNAGQLRYRSYPLGDTRGAV